MLYPCFPLAIPLAMPWLVPWLYDDRIDMVIYYRIPSRIDLLVLCHTLCLYGVTLRHLN